MLLFIWVYQTSMQPLASVNSVLTVNNQDWKELCRNSSQCTRFEVYSEVHTFAMDDEWPSSHEWNPQRTKETIQIYEECQICVRCELWAHDVKEGEKGVSLVSPRQEAAHCIWAMNTHPSATTVHNLKNQWVWDDYPRFHLAQFYQAFVSKIVERSLIVRRDVNWVPWPCRLSLFLQRRVPVMSSIFSTAPLV